MTESIVQVTEGAGKKLHTNSRTIGANTVEDEIVVLGENYLNGFTVVAGNVSTATANSHLLQIMAGASLKVRVRRIEMHQDGLATAAVLMETRLYRLTTAGTGGGVITPGTLEPGDTATATAMSLPTAKGTEGTLMAIAKPYMLQTIGASTPHINPVLVWDFDRPRSKPVILAAGVTNGIAIKNVTAVAAGTVMFDVWIDEMNF